MAFLGPESVAAAAAAECAGEQGRFWPYHDRLFAAQAGRNSGAFAVSNLQTFAADVGLKTDAFNECMASGRTVAHVQAETEAGRQKGVTGTPTIFVNGHQLDRGATAADIVAHVKSLLPSK